MYSGTPANPDRPEAAAHLAPVEARAAQVDPALFFQLASEPCLVLGYDGWLKRVNAACTSAFGCTAEFLCSAPFAHFIHPDDRDNVAHAIGEMTATGQPQKFACRLLQTDSRPAPVVIHATPCPATALIYAIAHQQPPQHIAAAARFNSEDGNPVPAALPAFIQSSLDGVIVFDKLGIIIDANPAAERLLAAPRDILLGQSLGELIMLPASLHPAGTDAPPDTTSLPGRRIEALAARATGATFLAEVTFTRLSENNADSILATLRDLTERRRAELEIEKLAAFPRFNPEAVLELNSEGAITYYNAAALDLARSIGQRHPSAFLPADAAAIARSCLSLGQSRLEHESVVGGRNIACSFFPVPGLGVVHCYASDVTVRKLAEDRITEQAALLDKASDSILVLNLDHGVLYWSHSAERLFGWTAADARGCDASAFLYKDSSAVTEARRTVLAGGEWNGELECHTRGGGTLLVESRWTLVRDANGHPKSILTLCHDVTEKRRIENQFLRAQRLESIGTLASGIAHDLNNILSPIMMSVNLLQERFNDDSSKRLLETLRVGVHRGADMVRQILAFTRGREGAHASVHLKPLISELTKILTQTFPKNITVRTDVARDLWPIEGDATQIYQVLMNLAVNARDAMPKGGVLQIEAANVTPDPKTQPDGGSSTPQSSRVALRVSDTGEGIPEAVRDKIWEPFFTSKPQGIGTGLGLSTVANIVKAHGGTIHAESAVGQGTTFTILLPASPRPEAPERTDLLPNTAQGRGERILVIDDERAFQEIIRAIFAKYGYRVLTASDGTEAVALFAQHRNDIDLVLTDMEMPHLDGPATINALRRLNPEIRIIAASGYSEKEKQGELLTGTEFLLKPFTTERLLAVVERNLKARPTAAY